MQFFNIWTQLYCKNLNSKNHETNDIDSPMLSQLIDKVRSLLNANRDCANRIYFAGTDES